MAKNKITDLNDILFNQLGRLDEEEMSAEEVNKEVSRAKAMSQISQQIINSNKLVLEAMKLASTGNYSLDDIPANFGINKIGGAQ
jgi:rRNA maturation endonuclease Nob1